MGQGYDGGEERATQRRTPSLSPAAIATAAMLVTPFSPSSIPAVANAEVINRNVGRAEQHRAFSPEQ